MNTAAMTNTDRALLISEWAARDDAGFSLCPDCRAYAALVNGGQEGGGHHQAGCSLDAALAERAYPDQTTRDRMRTRLARAADVTLPPPGAGD